MRRREWLVEFLTLGSILVVAALLRWHGLAWDDGYLFHPDERQIINVLTKLQLPASLQSFFSPDSPLNPRFFAYGSFPIYLLRLLAPLAPPTSIVGPWADDQLARWALLGRWVSGLFDLGTIVLTYTLGRRLYRPAVGLLGAAAVAVTVLHIQLSHFYAVDTLLTFFVMATLYGAVRIAQNAIAENAMAENARAEKPSSQTERKPTAATNAPRRRFWLILSGIAFGLALATKITALPLIFPLAFAFARANACPRPRSADRARGWRGWFDQARSMWRVIRRPLTLCAGIALLVFLATQPYALIDWYNFGRDVIREAFVARGWLDYPYTRQYANTLPFVYQIVQGSVWGMGLPLGIGVWTGVGLWCIRWFKTRTWQDTFLLSFALIYWLTISLQYAKYLRYLLPLLPLLYLMAASACLDHFRMRRSFGYAMGALVLASALVYAIAFVRMYDAEHPWLTASRWIYKNVPPGKTLMVEQWDDALPTLLQFPGSTRVGSEYKQLAFPIYDDDSDMKRTALARALAQSDLVILASQRLYGSIGHLPARYPLTTRYYAKLFDGTLGFEPVMTARRDPNLLGVTIRDDPRGALVFNASSVDQKFGAAYGTVVWNWGFADESFSVYDHPQPILFQKVREFTAAELAARLQ